MFVRDDHPNDPSNPVAILDKELLNAVSFRTEIYELCTHCGARFGIGYFGASKEKSRIAEDMEELPKKLIEILAKDHWREREHKGLIELDI